MVGQPAYTVTNIKPLCSSLSMHILISSLFFTLTFCFCAPRFNSTTYNVSHNVTLFLQDAIWYLLVNCCDYSFPLVF